MAYRIGVDIGGTFTDFALLDDGTGAIAIHKVLTTPRDPSEAVLNGVDELLKRQRVSWAEIDAIVHGTTLVIGIVQSLGTPWGLFRYYWVIVKLVLTIIAVAVLMLQTPTIEALALAASGGDLEGYAGARFSMMLHAAGGAIVLLIATVLSVYKPRGLTGYGVAALGGRGAV